MEKEDGNELVYCEKCDVLVHQVYNILYRLKILILYSVRCHAEVGMKYNQSYTHNVVFA